MRIDDVANKYPMVMIDWQDHTADGSWIYNIKDCDYEIARSIGWLIDEDDTTYKIANALTRDSGVGGVSVILKSCVLEYWEIYED